MRPPFLALLCSFPNNWPFMKEFRELRRLVLTPELKEIPAKGNESEHLSEMASAFKPHENLKEISEACLP